MINEDRQKMLEFQIRENVKKELLKGYKKQIIAYVTAITFILGLFGIQVRSWVIQKAEEQVKKQVAETVKKLENRVQTAEKKLAAEIREANALKTQLTGNMLISLTKVAEQLGQADSKAQEMERLLEDLSNAAKDNLKAFTNELDERSGAFKQNMAALDEQRKEIDSLIEKTRSRISLLEERIEKLERARKGRASNTPSEIISLASTFDQGAALQKENMPRAVLVYERALEQLPPVVRQGLQSGAIAEVTAGIHQQDREIREIAPRLFNALAWGYLQTEQQPEKRLRLSRLAVALDPKNGNYLDTLAGIYFAAGECEKAVKTMEAAVAGSHNPEYRKKLERYKECGQK